MPPRKRSKGSGKKAKPAARRKKQTGVKKPIRKKPARKKSIRKKPARNKSRASVPVVFRRKGATPAAADTVDTLGEWHHETPENGRAGEFTEDDIPPDYGGSE